CKEICRSENVEGVVTKLKKVGSKITGAYEPGGICMALVTQWISDRLNSKEIGVQPNPMFATILQGWFELTRRGKTVEEQTKALFNNKGMKLWTEISDDTHLRVPISEEREFAFDEEDEEDIEDFIKFQKWETLYLGVPRHALAV